MGRRQTSAQPLPHGLLALLAAACLALPGCKSTNPTGFWDLVSLEVVPAEGEGQLQADVGTMEWDERTSMHAVFRYWPGVAGQPLKDVYGDTDGTLAEDWLTPASPPILASGYVSENKMFNLNIGLLATYDATMTSYSGTSMSFEALDARIEGWPVELYFELER